MAVQNTEIAQLFSHLAELLEIEGANPFRVRAYRNAARTIENLPNSVAGMVAGDADLSELPGIGKDLAGKIKEIVKTGHLKLLDQVSTKLPGQLAELSKIPGLGPKRVKALYDQLGIKTVQGLEKAARSGKVRQLAGFGKRSEEKILSELGRRTGNDHRFTINTAEQFAEPVLAHVKRAKGVDKAVIAGSYRRRRETIGDIDILVSCTRPASVMDHFVAYEDVDQVVSKGSTRATIVLRNGLHVDLRAVPHESYGAALQYFTGSKAHNIAVRSMAVKKGLKINEYGVFRGDTRVAGSNEKEVYRQVGLPYIEPELRENRGEIEAGLKNALPRLVTLNDLRGDLHCHSKASDGQGSIEEMAKAALIKGYEYVAICDHSQRVTIARGLDAKRFLTQMEEIDRLNDRIDGITIVKGAEVDILEDGSLDLPDDVLKRLDLTVCSVHYKFNMSKAKQTERIIRAMDHPAFNILGHPTGRMLNEREPYEVDMEQIMSAAKERGRFLEVNAQPVRLDLTDVHCQLAKEIGVQVVISTDAHRPSDLDLMRYGVGQARRGWLEASDVLNTKRWKDLKKILRSA